MRPGCKQDLQHQAGETERTERRGALSPSLPLSLSQSETVNRATDHFFDVEPTTILPRLGRADTEKQRNQVYGVTDLSPLSPTVHAVCTRRMFGRTSYPGERGERGESRDERGDTRRRGPATQPVALPGFLKKRCVEEMKQEMNDLFKSAYCARKRRRPVYSADPSAVIGFRVQS